ncbi:MAG: hypothetical protein V4574_18510 [Pseudomonadota bacterium]
MSTAPEASLAAGLKAALPKPADLAGLEPIEKIRSRWPLILGGLLTLLMIAALGRELYTSGLAGLTRAVPTNPLFYLAFALCYLAPPTFDYLIFRRLWGIPLAGMAALHKKRIANEVLFGYSGEAYFYAWARQRTQMVAAPFGAVKDVTILSAIAGNLMTLAMILLVLPFQDKLPAVITGHSIAGSAGLMVLMCLPFLIFSKRVFSLQRPQLWWVFGMHMLRSFAGTVFVVFAWHFAMPEVAFGTWVFFAAIRLLASRLPLAPNKEVVFASFALLLSGSGSSLTELMALFAALTLLSHIALIGGFSMHGLLTKFAVPVRD